MLIIQKNNRSSTAYVSNDIPDPLSELFATRVGEIGYLEWKDNSDNEDGFVIQRDGTTIANVNQLPPNTRYFLDENLNPEFVYKYIAFTSEIEGSVRYRVQQKA